MGEARAEGAAAEAAVVKDGAGGAAGRLAGPVEAPGTRTGGAGVNGMEPWAAEAAGTIVAARNAASIALEAEGEAVGAAWRAGTAVQAAEMETGAAGIEGAGPDATRTA